MPRLRIQGAPAGERRLYGAGAERVRNRQRVRSEQAMDASLVHGRKTKHKCSRIHPVCGNAPRLASVAHELAIWHFSGALNRVSTDVYWEFADIHISLHH